MSWVWVDSSFANSHETHRPTNPPPQKPLATSERLALARAYIKPSLTNIIKPYKQNSFNNKKNNFFSETLKELSNLVLIIFTFTL